MNDVGRLLSELSPPIPEPKAGEVRFDYLDIRDERVQEFLWAHLNPRDIRFDYTKLDAMKFVTDQLLARRSSIYGDMERGIAVRVDFPNPFVACPHLMGNGLYVRGLLRTGLATIFAMGLRHVNILTQITSLSPILEGFGFSDTGVVPGIGFDDAGEPVAIHILSLSREKYYSEV
jgi:hypothetical protein